MNESSKKIVGQLPAITSAIHTVINTVAGQNVKFAIVIELDDRIVHASNCDNKSLAPILEVVVSNLNINNQESPSVLTH